MPRRYTRTDGTVVTYKYKAETRNTHSSGSAANLTLVLADPTVKNELAKVAQSLGLIKDRGIGAGYEGSINQLVEALGQAARRDGSEAVAKRLRRIL